MPYKPPPDRLFAEAAELRAGGMQWDAIAARVGRAANTVRMWPHKHPERWAAALRAAEARVSTEAAAESVFTLRQQLRSTDGEASRDAAHELIHYRVELDKASRLARTDRPPGPETAQVAAYLESLTDDQHDQLLDRALSVLTARRNARRAGGGPAGA
jgi:hypothetical protein